MIVTIVGWIVFGLIAGFIARAIVPGKDTNGVNATFQLVFKKPGTEALATGAATPDEAPHHGGASRSACW